MFLYFVSYAYFEGGGYSFGDGLFELPRTISSRSDLNRLKDKIESEARLPTSPALINIILMDVPTLAESEGLIAPISRLED